MVGLIGVEALLDGPHCYAHCVPTHSDLDRFEVEVGFSVEADQRFNFGSDLDLDRF